ncbi:cytochrome c oxidase subunit 8A, mitochondrial-like [Vulpes lagopus]|uniref:cytochrome c oxidase subunit 8A, mitochondrial-like n=1 Tax=Vulpes lagopus TaxID=494514 RepID=UPI001BC9D93C|nr:cytochrome c oxidase subunit 8A, mitochondrial-like [Vulpes lagopus]
MYVLTALLLRGLTGLAWRLLVPCLDPFHRPWEQLSTIGLTSCFLCFLLPLGWVLSHLESYKKWE